MTARPLPGIVTQVAGIGMSCQTAHQLGKYAEAREAISHISGPMDWMAASADATSRWISEGLPGFEPGDITPERGHAYWAQKRLWFWHWFRDGPKAANDPKTRALKINNTMDRELSKFAYQRTKFKLLSPQSTLFVFSNSQGNLLRDIFRADEADQSFLSERVINQFHSALEACFGQECMVHFVTRADRAEAGLEGRHDVSFIEPENAGWKGNDRIWTRELDRRRAHLSQEFKLIG